MAQNRVCLGNGPCALEKIACFAPGRWAICKRRSDHVGIVFKACCILADFPLTCPISCERGKSESPAIAVCLFLLAILSFFASCIVLDT